MDLTGGFGDHRDRPRYVRRVVDREERRAVRGEIQAEQAAAAVIGTVVDEGDGGRARAGVADRGIVTRGERQAAARVNYVRKVLTLRTRRKGGSTDLIS